MLRTIRTLLVASLVLPLAVQAAGTGKDKTYNLTTIDFPDAIATNIGGGISDRGDIVGWYTDAGRKTHGFLLSDGVYTTIDVPGAAITQTRGINARGDIVGSYQVKPATTPGGDYHGFLLRDGVFTTIDNPDHHPNTILQRISAIGVLVGCIHDADTMSSMHGFRFTADGFVDNGIPASMNNGTSPEGNRIVGFYADMMNQRHSYVVDKGFYTFFDVPGAKATSAWDTNPSGDIVGVYLDNGNVPHGFLRTGDEYLSIDFPGAIATQAFGINARGDIVGSYTDAGGHVHGFLAQVARRNP